MGAGGRGRAQERGETWSPFRDERSRLRQILQYDQVEGKRGVGGSSGTGLHL